MPAPSSSVAVALSLTLLLGLPACKKGSAAPSIAAGAPAAAAIVSTNDVITEELDLGTIAWTIGEDGAVKAVPSPTGGAKVALLSGQLTWKGDETRRVPMESKDGALVASAPKPGPGLTEVEYALLVDGQPWKGTLHVPEGGTRALVAGGEVAAKDTRPSGKGPHGGVVQIVGEDRIEIVADKGSGQARVYVLGEGDKPVEVGDREVRLAIVAERPEVVVLAPGPGRLYFVGTLTTRAAPVKVTIEVRTRGRTHVCLVGYRPGVAVVVTTRAPRVALWGHGVWVVGHDDDDDVRIKFKKHDHGRGKARVDIKIR